MSAAASAVKVPDAELDKLCSMLELFYFTPPATYLERPLEDAKFDEDEPAFNQTKWNEIIGPDYLSDMEPEHNATIDDMVSEATIDETGRAPAENTLNEESSAQDSTLDTQREQTGGVATPEAEPAAATPAEGEHTNAADDLPVDGPTPQEDAFSDYSLNSLFDEVPGEHGEETSSDQTRSGAAPESTVTSGTPTYEYNDYKAVTDEDTYSFYSFGSLFDEVPVEHEDATTAVDASSADEPTEADTAMDLPAKDDVPAGDEASAMSPPTQKVLSDDTQNIRTPPEDGPTDDELIAVAQTADFSMLDEATENVPVESTLVEKTPVEEASAEDVSTADKATDKAPQGLPPLTYTSSMHSLKMHLCRTPLFRVRSLRMKCSRTHHLRRRQLRTLPLRTTKKSTTPSVHQ